MVKSIQTDGIKATAIILDFMKGARVVENVKSILAQKTDFKIKIIVIDNSCHAGNVEILRAGLEGLKRVKLVVNEKNLGYIKAHNAVKNDMEGKYLFIINPDILWKDSGVIQKMADYMDAHPDIGILGPRQINDSGETAMTVRAFPKLYLQIARRTFLRKLPILKNRVAYDEMRHLDYGKIQDVDWLQSSCVAIRKDLWDKIGGLNEDYFLFMGDVELCYQSWKNGKRVVYFPDVRVYADGKRLSAGGFKKFFQSWVMRQHLKDSIKYRLKYFFNPDPRSRFYKTASYGK
jgi:GT2 family glycosyltransferase